jgi:type II secretory pathway pseudopilin PulG
MRIEPRNIGSRRAAASAGFSLAEVSVSMGVVGIVCVALYTAVSTSVGTVQLAQENLRATQILVEKMDTVRLYNWDQLNDPTFVATNFTAYFDPDTNAVVRGVVYNGTLTVSPGPGDVTYSNDLRTVAVSLVWTSATGLPRNRSFTSYVARYGLQNYIY